MQLEDIAVDPPAPGPWDWNDEGVIRLPGLFEQRELNPYMSEWRVHNGYERLGEDGVLHAARPGGYSDTCPYMHKPALFDLVTSNVWEWCWPIDEPMGVNLNLTGWVSTQRDWHADSYLNEPEVGDFYGAAWIALGDIHPDSGPFQYVPGSHRWPQVTRETIGRYFDLTDPAWPKHSEELLTPLFEEYIERMGVEPVTYLPEAGDVLLWHGRLCHRGSRPNTPGMYRPALIAHYSGIHHRPQMPSALRSDAGGYYFPIITDQPV